MLRFRRKKSARTGARAALLAGATVAALGLSGLGAAGAFAAPLCTGSNITGIGSSLQHVAQESVWAPAFHTEICNKGTEPTVTYESVGSGAGMKEWNFDGKRGSINTTKQFIGTDDAPTAEQITNIKSVAGGAHVLVIPSTQTAIAIVANPPAGCKVGSITNKDVQNVFNGTLLTWSKLSTAEEIEKGKCNKNIIRVVRHDGSGTTFQLKNYLYKLNTAGLTCTEGIIEAGKKATWKQLEPITNSETGFPNTTWPETCSGIEKHTLSEVKRPANKGGKEEVLLVNATEGSIGYAALPDAEANKAGSTVVLNLQNNGSKPLSEATFANPAMGKSEANCTEASYTVPTNAQHITGSTGLDVDWSQVFGAKNNIGGTKYPLCTLTYELAFNGYKAAGFTEANEVTVNDYLREYLVAAAGQTKIGGAEKFYAPLPTSTSKSKNVLEAAQFTASKIIF